MGENGDSVCAKGTHVNGQKCLLDETNTSICDASFCKIIDQNSLMIGILLISVLIFLVGFVWFLVIIFKKLADNNVAISNPAPVLGYPSNQMMLVSNKYFYNFQIQVIST